MTRATSKGDAALRGGLDLDTASDYLDFADSILIAIDPLQRVTYINKKGCDLLGYGKKDILGRNWFDDFLPKSVGKNVKSVFCELIAGKVEPMEYFENPILTKSGEERLISWHNELIRDKRGKIVSSFSSGQDITERRAAEKGMQTALERLQVDTQRKNPLAEANNVLERSQLSVWLLSSTNYNMQLLKLLKQVSEKYKKVVYVSLSKPCNKVLDDFEREGIDKCKFKLVCIGKKIDPLCQNVHFDTIDIVQVTGLSIKVNEVLEKYAPDALVFDSLHTMLAYVDKKSIIKFVQDLVIRIANSNCRGIFPIIDHGKDANLVDDLGLLVDEVVGD